MEKYELDVKKRIFTIVAQKYNITAKEVEDVWRSQSGFTSMMIRDMVTDTYIPSVKWTGFGKFAGKRCKKKQIDELIRLKEQQTDDTPRGVCPDASAKDMG